MFKGQHDHDDYMGPYGAEERNGECTNVGPVISTADAHRVYRSGCIEDCANCEYWKEHEED